MSDHEKPVILLPWPKLAKVFGTDSEPYFKLWTFFAAKMDVIMPTPLNYNYVKRVILTNSSHLSYTANHCYLPTD